MATSIKRRSEPQLKAPKRAKSDKKEKFSRPTKIEQEASDESDGTEDVEEDVLSVSEDDLDNLSENDEVSEDSMDVSEHDEEANGFDGANSSLSADERARRAEKKREQKQLQKERKLKKAHGAQIEEIKQLWESMRAKHGVSREERRKILEQVMRLVDGQWKDLIFRHDASRVVQTVFKYADKALRVEITSAMKGNYVDLAKSAYGKYLLVKMLHYGSPKVRGEIIDEMHGQFRKLMGHKEGAYVIEDIYRDYATAKQRRQIMREFFGSEFALFKESGGDKANLHEILQDQPEKRPYLLENLNRVITQAVNKGSIGFEIVHAMMLEYVRNIERDPKNSARETFVDLIADDFVEIVHTNAGSQVASLVLALSTAKERKRLLKSLRQFPLKLAKDNFGNIVMMAAFLTVDDTKLTHKAFAELETDMAEIMVDRYARRPFLMLLLGEDNKKYFGTLQQRFKEINEFKKEFSKKDDDARRKELLSAFLPAMNTTVAENMSTLASENLGMQFVMELLLSSSEVDDAAVNAVLGIFESDPALTKQHPLNINPISGRVAKLLARNNPYFAKSLSSIVQKYPVQWTSGEGCFAVVALLETLPEADAKKLRSKLQKQRTEISKSEAKGIDILMNLIK